MGIFLGLLVSIKPNFFLWVFLLAIMKNWKAVITSLIVVIICASIPLIRMSPEVYIQWFEAVSRVDSHVLTMPGNSSLPGLTSRMGIPQLGTILGLLLLVITTLVIFRNRDTVIESKWVHSAGIFLSLLVSPISWVGYTILTLPFYLSIKEWNIPTLVAAAILTVPFNFTMHFYYNYGPIIFIFWGWWYGFSLATCFIYIAFLFMKDISPNKVARQR